VRTRFHSLLGCTALSRTRRDIYDGVEYSTTYMGFTSGGLGDIVLVQHWCFGTTQKRVVFLLRRGRAIRPNRDKRLEVPLDGVTTVIGRDDA
jgi:hypothetical protein